jgi:hypothetical protein
MERNVAADRGRRRDRKAARHERYQQVSLQVMWKELGEVSRDAVTGRARFPDAPAGPGVYRLRLLLPRGREAWHVDETDDVQAALLAHEQGGMPHAVSVDLLAGAVVVTDGVPPRAADLGREEDRALLKMAACTALGSERLFEIEARPSAFRPRKAA